MMFQKNLVAGIAQVDALRGLAALIVVTHHATAIFPSSFGAIGPALTAIGDYNVHAVMLFFVISGFCIRSSLEKNAIIDQASARIFLARRAARIIPPYWAALALTLVLGFSYSQPDAFQTFNLVGNLLFLQTPASSPGNWFPPYGNNGPLWSISFEVFYYLFFPATVLASIWLRDASQRVTGLLAASLFSMCALIAGAVYPNPILSFSTLYVVWRSGMSAFECKKDPAYKGPTLAILVATIGLLVVLTQVRASGTANVMLIGLCLATAWILLQDLPWRLIGLSEGSVLIRMLSSIGAISYCLYLFHYPILLFAANFLGPNVWSLFAAIFASFLLAFLLERKFAALKAALNKRKLVIA